jgi:hypothetical protein
LLALLLPLFSLAVALTGLAARFVLLRRGHHLAPLNPLAVANS